MAGAQQLVRQRQHEEAVRAGRDADPLIGHGVIAGAHRVDGNDAAAARFQPADADLDRVGIVVLGDAEDHEELGPVPVRRAELPERAAERVDAAGRHVDRAEAAMRGIVRRAELLRPPAGQRLRLIAPGEEGELGGVLLAHGTQPRDGGLQRLVPGDLLELARAARPCSPQRPHQPAGRIMLHDPGAALGADHAAVDRVVAVALDIADQRRTVRAVPQVHVDAAAAGAHIAGGAPYLVRHMRREVEPWLGPGPGPGPGPGIAAVGHSASPADRLRHTGTGGDLARPARAFPQGRPGAGPGPAGTGETRPQEPPL